MGNYDQHMVKAAQTEQFARWLLGTSRSLDDNQPEVQTRLCWTVTAMFYSALHLVHARLAVLGLHPESHRGTVGTWTLVMMRPEFAPIRRNYSGLMDKSEQARYRFRRLSAALVAQLLDRDLQQVNDHIRALGRS